MTYGGKWRIGLYLDATLELRAATVDIRRDGKVPYEVVRMITGPFDSPDDILGTILELIEHAEWRGEQLTLPVAAEEP